MKLAMATVLVLLLSVPATGWSNVVSVQPLADTSIYEEDGTVSNGAGSHLFAGTTDDGFRRRGLLEFDVAAAVPAGSTIQSVTLTLYMSRSKANDETVTLHRVASRWGEGTSDAEGEEGKGAPATTNDATWTHRTWPSALWSTAGGDYLAAASASRLVGRQSGPVDWTGAGLVSDVQGWLDAPAQNFGWAIVGNEGASKTAKRFDTRENIDASRRPMLTIEFMPGSPTGACCRDDGACVEVNHPPSTCSDYQGQGSTCATTTCPQPAGACCLPVAAATCASLTEVDCAAQSGAWAGPLTGCGSAMCPVVLTPFVDPLPIPAVATPTAGVAGGTASYTMRIVEFEQRLHRDLPPTRVWGFDDGTGPSFPGQTLEATTGLPVDVTWVNDLREEAGNLRTEHYLDVDTCAHGANDQAPRTVVHLHGGHVPAAVDGYPEATFLPGQQVTYRYPNRQPAAPLWYHDHALGITRLNVYMGLAGLYNVRDATESALNLPAGEFEIPLVLQDRTFAPDGSLVYPTQWQEHFFGDTVVVNGKVWPHLDVKQGKYRFRIVGGSGSRTFTLALSDSATFEVVGNDGGLLPAPVSVSDLTIMPGERYDIVIDFAGYAAGSRVQLLNSAGAPHPGTSGVVADVMEFVVQQAAGHTAALPSTLRPVTPLDAGDAVLTRDFELRKFADPCAGSKWLINGLGWDDITEVPKLGTTEVWRFVNRSGVSHPMHMHLVFFQVLDRQPFVEVGGVITPTGSALPPAPHQSGWKDTVEVGPDEIVRVIAHFTDYTGLFAYHCHILEHEDHEMMRQFQTFTDCGDGHRGMPDEECDDGNLVDGDGCDSNCTPTGCGNGVASPPEECDDGNAVEGDGCDSNCTFTACGNGITTVDEECDDGNSVAGDGCESDCTVTVGADMGPADMGPADMGTADAGTGDMGQGDTGSSDMGPADTGVVDSGAADMGAADIGTGTGELDGGEPVDFGRGSDVGPSDTGENARDMTAVDLGLTLDQGTSGGDGMPGKDTDSGCCATVDGSGRHNAVVWGLLIFALLLRRRRERR